MSLEVVLAVLRRIRESGVDLSHLLAKLEVATDATVSIGERIRAAVEVAELLSQFTPNTLDDQVVQTAVALVNSDFFPRLLDLVDRLISGEAFAASADEVVELAEFGAINWALVMQVAQLIAEILQAWRS